MKRCPNCSRTFDDENDYCLEDGTPLTGGGGANYDTRNETPTQVLRTPVYGAPPAAQSRWVYPVIGALCGIVIVLGFIVFFKDRGAGDGPGKNIPENNRNEAQRTPDNGTPAPPPPSPTLPPVRQLANSAVTVDSPRDGYLALKEGPCITPCRTLIKIPHGARIDLGTCRENVEVADRRRGHWCYTSYAGYSGWVFDAFVAPV